MRLKTVVIPAAGFGVRFLPATKAVPKPMLPLVDKPQIQYAVEEARAAGAETIVFVTSRTTKGVIEEHFDRYPELEAKLESTGKTSLLELVESIHSMIPNAIYVRQKDPLGLGHAILQAAAVVGEDETFGVILPDDIIRTGGAKVCLAQMMEKMESCGAGAAIAVQRVPMENISAYGVIAPSDTPSEGVHTIRDLVEKPPADEAPSNLAIIGRYILPASVFEHIRRTEPGKGGEIQITDALRMLAGETTIIGCEFEGERFDAGDKLGFLQATVRLALEHPELGERFRSFLASLDLKER